jgi:NADH-quinone oxidoreductase subunit L
VIDGAVDGTAGITRIWSAVVGLFDLHGIDGAVNRLADGTMAFGNRLRNVQTGGINAYLYGIVAAVTVILIIRMW